MFLLPLLLFFLPVTPYEIRTLPNHSPADTLREIRRNIFAERSTSNSDILFNKSTSLDKTFDNLTLFKISQIRQNGTQAITTTVNIVCKKCYIKGSARAQLSATSFNTTTISNTLQSSFDNTFNDIKSYIGDVATEVKDEIKDTLDFDFKNDHDFRLPAPQIAFDLDIPALPETLLEIELRDVDMYIELGVTLSEGLTYTIPLFRSTQLGAQVGNMFAGAVLSIDLVLSVLAGVEMDTGFHVKMDEGVVMKLGLFAKEASDLSFNGAKFEFLPVTILTATTSLKAILRVSVRTGFSLGIDFSKPITVLNESLSNLRLSAGIEATAFANLAEFTTNITALNVSRAIGDKQCDLLLQQGYRLAIGAAAGASVAFLGNTYGPVPRTEIPIFSTGLSEGCAAKATPTSTSTPSSPIKRDDGMVTISTVIQTTYTATACAANLVNCPASLQTQSSTSEKTTLTTTIPSGQTPIWQTAPATTPKPIPFGKHAHTLSGSSGKPVSFVPRETHKPSVAEVLDRKTGGVSNRVIVGVSVGAGVPVLSGIALGVVIWRRRRARRVSTSLSFGDGGLPKGMRVTGRYVS